MCALLSAAPAFAQFDSATAVGTVRDTTAAVVPAAGLRTITASYDRHQVQLGFKLLW